MRRLVSAAVLFLSAVALAAPAFAGETPDPAPAPDAPKAGSKDAKAKADGVVCTRETPTGSLFPVKVCTTAAQRQQQNANSRRAQEQLQSGPDVIPH
ncbi:MAG: hypothetical protein J7521_09125 [Caulobacter sp.]|nr:hypothetical protein [Caulobacter sp.]